MSNNLYNYMQQGGPQNILQRFQQFRQGFRGDPRAQVQQMLNSGQITQAQYNAAVQTAQQLQKLLGGR